MYLTPFRGDKWCLREPKEYNGRNEDVPKLLLIHRVDIKFLLAETDQPMVLNVQLVINRRNNYSDDWGGNNTNGGISDISAC
jgi:hypothetical protein